MKKIILTILTIATMTVQANDYTTLEDIVCDNTYNGLEITVWDGETDEVLETVIKCGEKESDTIDTNSCFVPLDGKAGVVCDGEEPELADCEPSNDDTVETNSAGIDMMSFIIFLCVFGTIGMFGSRELQTK